MLKSLLIFLLNSFKTKSQLKLEIIILTKQIEILQRTNQKLKITKSDRLLFSIMKDLLSSWKERLFIVKPETEIKWHRTAFKSYLSDYVSYYNKYRTHLGINKDLPDGRPVQIAGRIEKLPAVNGLHHVDYRQAA